MKRTTFQQFDVVQILTTRNVEWRCDDKGSRTDPNGIWTIVAAYPSSGILLIQKENALARIPASDIKKVANYDLEKVFQEVDKINKRVFRKEDDGN